MSDAGAFELRIKVKSGAATANGATHAMAATYHYFRDIDETGQDIAAGWTSGGVNILQIGREVVT